MASNHKLKDLESQFHREMLNIYEVALARCKYRATRFLQLISEHGGSQAAKKLLHTLGLQYGFTSLWECGCLHITMENLVLRPRFSELFTEEEQQIARTRLEKCDFDFS